MTLIGQRHYLHLQHHHQSHIHVLADLKKQKSCQLAVETTTARQVISTNHTTRSKCLVSDIVIGFIRKVQLK